MVLLKEETFNKIKSDNLSPQSIESLSSLGMIIPDITAEKQEVMRFLEIINENNKFMNISVILNLDCNFSCVYCYEDGLKGKFYMTDETADLLLEFIKKSFTPEKKCLNIDFYGGEPLLSIKLIKTISETLKSMIERRGAEYTFTLVTNGSLLTRQAAEELVPLGLTGVKITLDGPPETHNLSRPFKSGAGSFDTVIKNIRDVCDLIKVSIGGNYQKNNYGKFPRLLDCMAKQGLTPDKIRELKFDPAINSPKNSIAPVEFTDGLMSINEPWVIESGIMLREEILKRGYSTPKLVPSSCQVDIKDAFVVNYDGVIYKCPSLIGKKGFEVGNLRDGVSDYTDSHKLDIWKNKECAGCEYLPLCFGGCRYMSYVRDGNIDNVDCRKPYLDAALETLIKQDIMYAGEPKNS
jgi:uncharacterized protein